MDVQVGGYIELVENDTFKERLFKVEMISKSNVMCKLGFGAISNNLIVNKDMIKSFISEEDYKQQTQESELVEAGLFSKDLFNVFNG